MSKSFVKEISYPPRPPPPPKKRDKTRVITSKTAPSVWTVFHVNNSGHVNKSMISEPEVVYLHRGTENQVRKAWAVADDGEGGQCYLSEIKRE